jgi:hypothetical protein
MNFFKYIKIPIICLFGIFYFKVNSFSQTENNQFSTDSVPSEKKIYKKIIRSRIVAKLNRKIANSEPLIVHTFVPLCDNKYQRIIKVGAKLGDGRNLETNLYWGAGYGLKNYFSRSKDWKYVKSFFDPDSSVLERAIYFRIYPNKAKVYLILDAYKGDKMKECITGYFQSLAGISKDSIKIDALSIPAFGNADFIIFNGHNGLMDNEYSPIDNVDNVEKDAAAISCASDNYFSWYFPRLKTYPLITTTNFLPPEAYIISAIIDNWATMQPDEKIRTSAGESMAKVHNTAVKPCVNTFKTGW